MSPSYFESGPIDNYSCPRCGERRAMAEVELKSLRNLNSMLTCSHCEKDSRIGEWRMRKLGRAFRDA